MTVAERRAIVNAVIDEFGEDYYTMGRIVKALRTTGVSLATLKNDVLLYAQTKPSFTSERLSIQWWVDEVARLSA